MYKGKVFSFVVLVIVFVYFPGHILAQEKMNSAQVDEKSYNLYLSKSWKELIVLGNNAAKQGIDYYYLRMRIGVAYYETHDYMKADRQFTKALAFNSGDPTAEEYLYFCYLYTGRYMEARKLSKTFTKELARKVGTDSVSAISFIMVEGGIKISDSTRLFHDAGYAQIGLGHYVNKSILLFHAVTYYTEAEFRGKTSQFQYYLAGNIPIKNDWEVAPAFQWINRALTPPPPLDTAFAIGKGTPLKGNRPSAAPTASTVNYFIGSMEIRKKIGHFNFALGGCISNIDSSMQYMETGSIAYFPLGNSRFALGAQGYLVESNNYGTESAVSPFISVMPCSRLTLSAGYLYSTVFHLIEDNGYIVNNSFDLTPSRWTFQFSVALSRTINVYGLYQLENKVETIAGFDYNYQAFIIGLKITPK